MIKKPMGALILHGFSSSLDCVRGLEEPLQKMGLPTRMPVLRGHSAGSPAALRGVKWWDWVSDAQAALDDLLTETEKAILIGHSMGGLLAILMAGERSEQIDCVVLAAAALKLASPLSPGQPLHFLFPLLLQLVKKWKMQPIYADPDMCQYDTNYRWVPTDSIASLLELIKVTRQRLSDMNKPVLILQSRNDSSVSPESVEIIRQGITTPERDVKIVWFEKTEHEMFRDIERDEVIRVITDYVRERMDAIPR